MNRVNDSKEIPGWKTNQIPKHIIAIPAINTNIRANVFMICNTSFFMIRIFRLYQLFYPLFLD